MDELAADDDLLSSMLLDSLEFEPTIITHKMNPLFRPVRFDRDAVSQLVRRHVVWEQDIPAAVAAFQQLPVVRKHLQAKTPAQQRVFESHIRRYLQAYLPHAGFEYAVTHRYKTARLQHLRALDKAAPHPAAAPISGTAPGRADLCVLATRAFEPDDIITHCTAALRDLSRSEDEALREEAQHARSADLRRGHAAPQRDFSIIRSSRRKCSQLLLGPARFINHDCEPNAEFRRASQHLSIRCIRPIAPNEEITTYYGENYFEARNRECMCASCEALGAGFFASHAQWHAAPDGADAGPSSTAGRTLRPRAVRAPDEARARRRARHVMGDPDAAGDVCACATCHDEFRAPEKWWTPDECLRCERHYKLFKCDWPSRIPTENPSSPRRTDNALLKRVAPPSVSLAALREDDALLQGATSSPVKLSPVRDVPANGTQHRHTSSGPRRRRYEVRSDDSDDTFETDHVALGPQILGPGASTDVLASYWGAPDGGRRVRRRTALAAGADGRLSAAPEAAVPQREQTAPPDAEDAISPLPHANGRCVDSGGLRSAASPLPTSIKQESASASATPEQRAAWAASLRDSGAQSPARTPHSRTESAARGTASPQVAEADTTMVTATVRQPARRNLRWGNGKTSISRVVPANAAVPGMPLGPGMIVSRMSSHGPVKMEEATPPSFAAAEMKHEP
ncbi:[histone H3]-lysine(4) N-trimethyltransferase [Malassezia sp. CBS 17886]|nr:[histone H3]-lysine(4) N-trimethyltransferase [Malassezia sp. CBS 17886]